MEFKPPKDSRFISQVQADWWMAGMEETHRIPRENIIEAYERHTMYAAGKEMTFVVGHNAWLSTRNFKPSRPSTMLKYKRTGPCTVSNMTNKNAYKLDFPSTIRNHNVFYLSLRKHYTPQVRGH